MTKKTSRPVAEYDPLATVRVHLQGLRDYAMRVDDSELAREIERQVTVLQYAWEKGVDPHQDASGPVSEIEGAFRRLGYTVAAMMTRERERK